MIDRELIWGCIRDAIGGGMLPPMGMDRFEVVVDAAADAVMQAIRYDAARVGRADTESSSGSVLELPLLS